MIITVTLNAAIDKTLEVPNLRIGRRHRSVEQPRVEKHTVAVAFSTRHRSTESPLRFGRN